MLKKLMIGLTIYGMTIFSAIAGNVLRNAGFELDATFNGTHMRQGDEFYMAFVKHGESRVWTDLPVEGWWAEGPSTNGITVVSEDAHGRECCLCLAPAVEKSCNVVSALTDKLPAGQFTLSAWVRTEGASGKLSLVAVDKWNQLSRNQSTLRETIPLPADSGWVRLQVTAQLPRNLQMAVRLQVDSGTVWLDDVQLETGAVVTDFRVRPEEWLRLGFADVPEDELAKWVTTDRHRRTVRVRNDSQTPLSGEITLYRGPWNDPRREVLGTRDAAKLVPGKAWKVRFKTRGDRPDAYVVSAVLKQDETTLVDGVSCFLPKEPVGGKVSRGMLSSRAAIRYALAPDYRPEKLFGVGNSMLDTGHGSWFQGWRNDDYLAARELGLTCARSNPNEDGTYLLAAGAIPTQLMRPFIDQKPSSPELANPAAPGFLDLSNPASIELLRERAEAMGKRLAANPLVASYQMANESPYLNHGKLCPSVAADADFREWCRRKYRSLDRLNELWETDFTVWEQVEQIASAAYAEDLRNQPKLEGAAAIDWKSSTGKFSPAILERMKSCPGQAMDWTRWRTWRTLESYRLFRKYARKHDRKTLYSTNLCWPSFWPQMFMPFTRMMDVTMLDVQYTSGLPRALGNPYEMMDIMEMAESSAPDKPVWGIEIYVQPQWPAAYAGFQNWGMVAHGMTNDMTFGWRPYSDAGPIKETRAWEKPKARPMWFLIDKDGTELPAYAPWLQSVREVAEYHRRFDGFSIRRPHTRVAFYVSNDTGNYVVVETGNKPWDSKWQRTRNTLIFALRFAGVAVDYVDDANLPNRPGRYQTIVVPASYVLSQKAAGRLADFARRGGTVVLAGASGIRDPWLRPYANLGGPAWSDLAWQAPELGFEKATVSLVENGIPDEKSFRGENLGTMARGAAIKDLAGATIGWTRDWGKGRLIASAIVPDVYSGNPHLPPALAAWTKSLIELADLPIAARWVGDQPNDGEGKVGEGMPVVEVVVREKSKKEKFVFILNQGGDGSGTVEVALPGGGWQAEDIITTTTVPDTCLTDHVWSLQLDLPAWGYRILRLTRP